MLYFLIFCVMEKDDFSNDSKNKNKSNHFILSEISIDDIVNHIASTTRQVLEVLDKNKNKAILNSDFNQNLIKDAMPIWEFPTVWDSESISKSIDLILNKSKVPNYNSPNYFGHMLPTTTIHNLVTNNIATIFNQNIIAEEVWPVFTHMENVVIWYLADLIWFDINKAWWSMGSWWTNANHTALIVARNKMLPNLDELWIQEALENYNKENNTQYKKLVALHWNESHYSIEKLWWYIWVGSKNMKNIPHIDWTHKLDLEQLKNQIDECEKNNELIISIIVTAWTTEKWHVQDIKWVNEIAKKWQNNRPIHFHVDAAHWWWFLTNQKLKETIFAWIEEADSVTIDWHKMLYSSYSSWGWWIVFKDKNDMDYIKHSAGYVIPKDSEDDNHWAKTIEWSRWAWWVYQLYSNIKSFWKQWYNKIFQKLLDNKEYLIKKLKERGDIFEIMNNDAELNLVCFRFKTEWKNNKELNKINDQIKKELDSDWTYFVSNTKIDEIKMFRAVFMNPSTEQKNIDSFLDKTIELIEQI